MSKYTKIADKIVETYEDNLVFLRPKFQWHYLVRKWRIDNDHLYIQPILASYQLLSLRGFDYVVNIANRKYVEEEGKRKLSKWSGKTERMVARRELYMGDPQQLYYFQVIKYMFYLKTFYLHEHPKVKPFFDVALQELKKIDFAKWLFSPEMLKDNPSGVSNYTFYLQFLRTHDYEDRLIDAIRDYWANKKDFKGLLFENKIYGHTHLILAASYYYQRTLDGEKFEWVLKFFEENFERILQERNADLIAEVGLVFRLCGKGDHEIVKKCQDYLIEVFDEDRGLIPKEGAKSTLERLEHRNILAIMLLSDWDKLNLGPNLNVFIKELKRGFFLPKKGIYI